MHSISSKLFPAKQIRVRTLNFGILTALKEEIRWSGANICDSERERGKNGYKLLYLGSSHTQYGVGITKSEYFRDAMKEVERFNDRLMKLTIISVDCTIHSFTAYAPQTGRLDAEKLLDAKTCTVPADDVIFIVTTLMVIWVKK